MPAGQEHEQHHPAGACGGSGPVWLGRYRILDAAELQKSIKQAGEQVLGQAQAQAVAAGLTPEVKILESWGDKIASVLLDDANSWGADLVVMGTHGWSGLMHILMGSVAEGCSSRQMCRCCWCVMPRGRM
jgi:nucleotide-binding universal stress UspA family protein